MKAQTIKTQGQAHNRRHFLKLLLLASAGAFARKLRGEEGGLANATDESAFDLNKAVLIPFPADHPQRIEHELKGELTIPREEYDKLFFQGKFKECWKHRSPALRFPLPTSEPSIFISTITSFIAGDRITITLYYNTSSNHFDEPVLFSVALLDKEKNILSLQRRRGGPLRPRRPDEGRMIISFVPKTYDPVRVDFDSIDIEKMACVAIGAE